MCEASDVAELLKWLKEFYQFSKAPSSPQDFDNTKALVFTDGSFQSQENTPLSVELRVYGDGFVADTLLSTDASDEFLNQVLRNISKEFGLRYKPENIRRRMYLSELTLKCETPLEDVCPKLREFAGTVSRALNRTATFSSVGWWTDPEHQNTLAQFRFERKFGAAFTDERYFSVAPLRTDDHLKLLKDLEAILKA
jgi:hypothetical protein